MCAVFLWHAIRSNTFVSSYKHLSSELAERVDNALRTLLSSERPERLGVFKTGPIRGLFAYEIGAKCRILYRPDYERRAIELFRVCSHKVVYGR